MAPKKPAIAPAPAAAAEPAVPVDAGPETDARKLRFREAFTIFDQEKTGSMLENEIPALLRYLGIFVTDADWATLQPEILKTQAAPYVEQKHLEAHVIKLQDAGLYEAAGPATLFAAFRALDKGDLGYIEVSALKSALQGGGGMTEEEFHNFLRLAAPRSFNPAEAEEPAAHRVQYTDYVALMARFR